MHEATNNMAIFSPISIPNLRTKNENTHNLFFHTFMASVNQPLLHCSFVVGHGKKLKTKILKNTNPNLKQKKER